MSLKVKLILSIFAGSLLISVIAGLVCFYRDQFELSPLDEALAVFAVSISIFSILALLVAWPAIKSVNLFTKVIGEITKGNLEVKIEDKGDDEIGELAKAFNAMILGLRESRENIEKRVAERTADLEKINKFMVGREIKMIDLKRKINELAKNQCRKE